MPGRSRKKYGLYMVERPVGRKYLGIIDAARIAAMQGVDMKATYGFRAPMTALPGRGDELAALLLTATSGTGPRAQALLAPLVTGETRHQDEVPLGGKLNVGGLS
ncbi:hypothetical protein [Myxococcus sp. SDU36]|uniref:hypothetical protein n=1 Tax=Myxococcus sp. SDU36 TaxID=2831967 RepID=UPI002542AAD8|nr:hypothetical protein [Myxococcus sp. SDU36]WIG92917.1 hypothetical protein KGD87_20010 [Myxococcus sp. SDU36]